MGATIDVQELIGKLQRYKYVCAIGGTVVGPLKSAPKIEPDTETKDLTLYETGSEVQASILSKNNLKLTLELNDFEWGMTELQKYKKGDNILAEGFSAVITLTPIGDKGGKTITFPKAFLQPDGNPTLEDEDDPNSVTLNYICRPDEDGKPFTYA